MSKAILEFSIPEESEEFEIAAHAGDFLGVVSELSDYLRDICKYEERKKWPSAEDIRAKLYDIASAYSINKFL